MYLFVTCKANAPANFRIITTEDAEVHRGVFIHSQRSSAFSAVREITLRIDKALQWAYSFNMYAYDAYMLDCAQQYNMPLLSLDKRLINIAKESGLSLIEVTP
jgi:predicted nucleic acid-binding protein